jgi:hypothetical protein
MPLIVLTYMEERMTIYEATVAKLQQMPEAQVQEVQDFVDFLTMRRDVARWQAWQQYSETTHLSETGMIDYLAQLEDYEDRLTRGEIQW